MAGHDRAADFAALLLPMDQEGQLPSARFEGKMTDLEAALGVAALPAIMKAPARPAKLSTKNAKNTKKTLSPFGFVFFAFSAVNSFIHLYVWTHFFRLQIPWWRVGESLSILAGYNLTFLIIGCAAFQRRDTKS